MQQNPSPTNTPIQWTPNKYYRSRPLMYEPIIIGQHLCQISGINLLIYNLQQNFQLKHSIPILSKQDQYCARLRKLNEKFLVLFGMTTFYIFSVDDRKITDKYDLENMFETIESNKGYISIVVYGQEDDQEIKTLNCWKVDQKSGKIIKKYQPFNITYPDYEDCQEELIKMRIILSFDYNPRIYIYWKGTNQMIELDPTTKMQEKYSRTNAIYELQDIDSERYAEIQQNRIMINSKKGGKELAHIINQGEEFERIFLCPNSKDQIYTISNLGLKKWKMEKNSTPISYESAEKYKIKSVYFDSKGRLYGLNTETNHILFWQKASQCIIHHFPHQDIKRVIKVNENQIFILLEAMADRQQEHEFHVEKYNKMEIYDIEKGIEIAKKGVLKFEYKIDIDSAIISDQDTVRFILNETNADDEKKKYIFRWSPFTEDKKKEIKKREIVGASKFDFIKLYPFDRIVTLTKPKGTSAAEVNKNTYSVFGNKQSQQQVDLKTQIGLYDFSAKKFGDYDMKGKIQCVEMSNAHQLYVVSEDTLSVYSINSGSKNSLEKIHEIEVSISTICPLADCILIQRGNVFTLYDKEFELIMKEELTEFNEEGNNGNSNGSANSAYKVLPIGKTEFILATDSGNYMFDLQKEESKYLKDIPHSDPNLTEIISGRIVVADKWLRAYSYHDSSSSV